MLIAGDCAPDLSVMNSLTAASLQFCHAKGNSEMPGRWQYLNLSAGTETNQEREELTALEQGISLCQGKDSPRL